MLESEWLVVPVFFCIPSDHVPSFLQVLGMVPVGLDRRFDREVPRAYACRKQVFVVCKPIDRRAEHMLEMRASQPET